MIKKAYFIECDGCGTTISHCYARGGSIPYRSEEEALETARRIGFLIKGNELFCHNCAIKLYRKLKEKNNDN